MPLRFFLANRRARSLVNDLINGFHGLVYPLVKSVQIGLDLESDRATNLKRLILARVIALRTLFRLHPNLH